MVTDGLSFFQEEYQKDRFVIVDGHALIYRAYHAFPGLTDGTGRLVNAVYGFSRILLTAIRDLSPEYLAVAFDHKEKTHRAKEFEHYKANRPEMPDDLKPQIELVKEVVKALNIPSFEQAGYEADDLIGTISKQVSKDEKDVVTVIVTGDKDLFQLVDDHVHVWVPGRGKRSVDTEYDAGSVLKKMGVPPERVVDLKALMGDPSDNIPGVKGVGPKSAVRLLTEYGSLDGIYEAVEALTPGESTALLKGALLEKLKEDKQAAYDSYKLATIQRDVKIDFSLEPCKVSSYSKEAVTTLFKELDFQSLLSLLPKDSFETEVQQALF